MKRRAWSWALAIALSAGGGCSDDAGDRVTPDAATADGAVASGDGRPAAEGGPAGDGPVGEAGRLDAGRSDSHEDAFRAEAGQAFDGGSPAADARADAGSVAADGPFLDAPADGAAGDGAVAMRGDVGAPPDALRGTPMVAADDPGTGPAREAAGYYRLAFEAWGPGLSFPAGRRTVVDFYYASTFEVISTGLGGRLSRAPNRPGFSAVYPLPYGDGLELVLDLAQVPPFRFMLAYLRERGAFAGTFDAFPYPGVVNKVAEAPFAGGPSAAPPGDLVPAFFGLARGTVMFRCTNRKVLVGMDDTWTEGQTYAVTVNPDGTVQIATNAGSYTRRFDQTRDTHAWPDAAGSTRVTFNDPQAVTTTLVFDPAMGGFLEIARTMSAGVFATYTLARQ